MSALLPEGWAPTTLKKCLIQKTGKVDPKEFPRTPYLAMDDIESNTGRLLSQKLGENFKSQCAQYTQGDILYGRLRPYLNKVMRAPFDGLASAELLVYTSSGAMDLNYAERILRSQSFLDYAAMQSTGDRPRLSPDKLAEFSVWLPPLAEQKRIVEKLDSLTTSSREAATALSNVETLIEQYHRSLLQYELLGRHYPDLAVENDLNDILPDEAERGEWASSQIPKDWEWVPFKQMFDDHTDSRRKLKRKEYESEGPYLVIDQGQDKGGFSNREDLVHRSSPPFIIFGDHTKAVKWIGQRFIQGADGIKTLKAHQGINARFAYFSLLAIKIPDKGYSRHSKFVKASYFPLPPVDEQEEIVARIESALVQLDTVKAAVTAARNRLEALDQAMLDRAFKGKLVPQDPNDEPASILLERIKTEKKTRVAKVKGPKAVKTEIRIIPKMSVNEQIEKAVTEGPTNGTTFEELNQLISGSYDEVKDAVFEMLSGSKPKLKQKFDDESKIMRLLKA